MKIKQISCLLLIGCLLCSCGLLPAKEEVEAPHEYAFVLGGIYVTAYYDRQYNSPQDLAWHSDLVIYGEVESKTCFMEGDYFVTHETVRVIEALQGDCEAGSLVTVQKTGGEVLLKDYIEHQKSMGYDITELEEKYTEKEKQTLYAASTGDCRLMSEKGQRSVYYLHTVPEKDFYIRLNDSCGQYLEVAEDMFIPLLDYKPGKTYPVENPKPLEQVRFYNLADMREQCFQQF